jgi:molybdenum cofactor cytidylyltransferase
MPNVEARLVDALIGALEARPNAQAIAPAEGGRRGNPVLLGRRLFEPARRLEGDEGARRLLASLKESDVVEIDPPPGSDVSFDVDTPSDLVAARRG